ncbi:MAG TPA: DUF2723 domain-containing protein [Thermoanaerobaculia bacterium]|jgi:hypothetical protein|nr:DUF2723 domain-containing protein [Thermoanaerobaculia bacterium]
MRPLLLAAAVVFAVALGVYLVTLAPTVGLTDSGELTVAAWAHGNAHPPGFPLYLLLTHLFTLLPIRSVAWRVNFASAFFAALACGAMVFAVASMTARRSGITVAVFAGLMLAFSRTLWNYATVAEVYALNTFLIVAMLALVLAWYRTRADRLLYAAAFVFGLGLCVHHVTVGLCIAGIAALAWRADKKQIVICALFAIAALSIYAYLPIAASHNPPLNWGDPDSLGRFVDHVTGKQYRGYLQSSSGQFAAMLGLLGRDLGPIALLLALWGVIQLWRTERPLFLFVVLLAAADLAWAAFYPIANDRDAYLLPAIIAIVLAAAYGAATMARGRLAWALLLVPLLAAVFAYPQRDRGRFLVPKLYAENALRQMRPNALLLTSDWQLYAPLMYFQEVEHARPDVIAVETGMLNRPWYVEQLERRQPALMQAVKPQLDAYRPVLNAWESDNALKPRMFTLVADLIQAMIETRLAANQPVYATTEFVAGKEPVLVPMLRTLGAKYPLLPQGVLVEYNGTQPQPLNVDLEGLAGAYQEDDPVLTEVLPAYRSALLMRGRYMALRRRYDDAAAAYKLAQSLDPENPTIQRELVAVEAMR